MDVGLVSGDGAGDGHAGLAAVEAAIRLVEGEDGVGAVVGDRGANVAGPDGGQRGIVVEEERDES